MGLRVKNYKSDKNLADQMKKVYDSAFPPDEKAPFSLIMRKAEQKKAEFLTAHENGEFVGFAYTVCYGDIAYLFYLAVDENKRGRGYGKKIVDAVKVRYKGKKIFLAREQLDESAENYQQRINRRNFYIKCGFKDIPYCIKEATVIYDVMSIDGADVTPQEYDKLITNWGGVIRKKIFDMKLFRTC